MSTGPTEPTRSWPWVVRGPVNLIRAMFRWFQGAPRWMQAVLLLVSIVLLGSGGYYLTFRFQKRQQQRAVRQEWEQFEKAVKTNSVPDMKKSLEKLTTLDTSSPLAGQRLSALERLDADPADEAMTFLTLRLALQQQRWEDAAREAQKRLKLNPKDWLSRCVVALNHLQQRDPAAAIRELDQLADPTDLQSKVQPSGLLLSFRLFRALNRDTIPLRRFVETNVAAVLRNPNLDSLSATDKLSLIECFLESITPRAERLPASIVEGWAPLNNLLASASEEALKTQEVGLLLLAGKQTNKLDLFLKLLVRDGAISLEQARQSQEEYEQRTRKIWAAVAAQNPKSSDAYRGQALSYLRENNYAKAREVVARGLEQGGADAELLTLYSRMLQLEGQAEQAYEQLVKSAEANPGQAVHWWGLAAEAAIAANRRDLALEACQRMRKVQPDNSWATRTEAWLWLEADQPQRAWQLLQLLDTKLILQQPILAQVYSSTLVAVGKPTEAEQLLTQADQRSRETSQPTLVVAVLTGWFKVLQEQQQVIPARKLAEQVDRFLELWPEEVALMQLRADVRLMLAELETPRFEATRVSQALLALERIYAQKPEETALTLGIAKLHLFGQKNPAQAARDLAPILTPERIRQLTPQQLTLVGQILRQNEQFQPSLEVLILASRSREAKAGTFIQLAMTYHLMGRSAEATRALQTAQPMPRTAQEQEDYLIAAKLIVP